MTSFGFAAEPVPQPRLAAAALIVHVFAAVAPWLTRTPLPLAIAISVLSLVGLFATLSRIPGRHCRLAALRLDAEGLRARLAGRADLVPADWTSRARAVPPFVSLEVRVGGKRVGWLLTRGSLPERDYRRLRARIRLSC